MFAYLVYKHIAVATQTRLRPSRRMREFECRGHWADRHVLDQLRVSIVAGIDVVPKPECRNVGTAQRNLGLRIRGELATLPTDELLVARRERLRLVE